ncbi:mitochondrial outer membrane protein (Sam35), putative [Talaromyces stipitatus ATCC 10500]|uniref:Mitochondrial outer membrane protein (Sam35), putative n=1 Tax=Talaromyces stipitatus (strain ATCC 10500 / CBS 375.48 / QM 6759 / NRRL 1006) TaxID=441959 RepID=B8M296_TALSN|nr:mitochondrial outer membrane protein (Sam35), putative [Talaromyces stipitatus ATCC 10500]EED21560.1 mitochondrial outer membrane protein (Sam35), putative [Talaromyces stipitatus ATCC 10500]
MTSETRADAASPVGTEHEAEPPRPTSSNAVPPKKLFGVPAPVKRIFDKFPLTTYEAEGIPGNVHTSGSPERNRLFVFIDPKQAAKGAPSFNPQCLRWQAYLKFVGIDFDLIPSNNHASPTGALPFLYAALPSGTKSPIPSNKLQKWAIEQVHCEEEQQLNIRFDVYASLIDHRIRNAWLHQLYLNALNFNQVARKRYINPATSSSAVQTALAVQLQQAARDELLKYSDYIDVNVLEADADNAFEALSVLLGDNDYFFNRIQPGLFDANVFAYTHLILDESMGWKYNQLAHSLSKYDNLLRHRRVLLQQYFA